MKKLLLLLFLALSPATKAQDTALPQWMAGAWLMKTSETGWYEEYWTAPRGGLMLGAAREGDGKTLKFWEQMQIRKQEDGSLSFFAQPLGKPPSEFPMVEAGDNAITFANPDHDYPQRIRYWRDGTKFHAEIALIDGSNAHQFTFHPMGSSE